MALEGSTKGRGKLARTTSVCAELGSGQSQACRLWSWSSFRFRIAVALALALAIEGLMRSNINMAMVCMVNRTALAIIANGETGMNDSDLLTPPITSPFVESANNTEGFVLDMPSFNDTSTTLDGECGSSKSAKKRIDDAYEGDLVISKSDQALIFTSFYAGGLAIVMPGSYLCDWFGARSLVLVGAMINVIGTFATPVVARTMGSMALAALRFVMGCGQGILVPCMNVLITHWFPLSEKSTAIAIATTGNQVSVIAAMFLTAELCQLSWLGGWPSAFYTYGVVGVILCVTWFVCVYDTPAKAKRISEEEVRFIHEGEAPPSSRKLQNVPWSRMMRSLPVWSLSLCAFSQNFMNVGTVVYLPSYYNSVLRMDLTSNGVMSALPFVVQLVTKILFAWLADTLKARQLMSHTNVTKMFNLIASLGSGVCFILITYCDCRHTEWAIFLAVAAVGLSSGFIPGYNTSVVCIAPRYTASVASFSRLLGQIASVASPYMIGIIVKKGTREEWQVAFYVMAFVLISTGLLFQVGGSASIQEWARVNADVVTSAASTSLAKDDDRSKFLPPS